MRRALHRSNQVEILTAHAHANPQWVGTSRCRTPLIEANEEELNSPEEKRGRRRVAVDREYYNVDDLWQGAWARFRKPHL